MPNVIALYKLLMKSEPIYIENLDGTHCFQACLWMVIGSLDPKVELSWEALRVISGKREGKFSWQIQAAATLVERGYEVIVEEDFDYSRFHCEGASYLIERYGPDVGKNVIENIDVVSDARDAKHWAQVLTSVEAPSIQRLESLLDQGYLLICLVNGKLLRGESGYVGHFVVVYDYDDNSLIFHDPGPNGKKSYRMPRYAFIRAWASPTERDKNVLALERVAVSAALESNRSV